MKKPSFSTPLIALVLTQWLVFGGFLANEALIRAFGTHHLFRLEENPVSLYLQQTRVPLPFKDTTITLNAAPFKLGDQGYVLLTKDSYGCEVPYSFRPSKPKQGFCIQGTIIGLTPTSITVRLDLPSFLPETLRAPRTSFSSASAWQKEPGLVTVQIWGSQSRIRTLFIRRMPLEIFLKTPAPTPQFQFLKEKKS
ncbi:MAG: hypothetical protein AB7F28_00790 [Candidatus Margulisiibacteriota bacterium]